MIEAYVLYFLASLGFAFVVGFSKISLPFRVLLAGRPASPFAQVSPPPVEARPPLVPVLGPLFVSLLECPGCLGMWTGMIAWVWRSELHLGGLGATWPWITFLGLVTCASNMIGARYLGLVE